MKCNACFQEKAADAFYVSNRTRCKECVKAAVTAHRLENIERVRSYDKMRASMPHRVAARADYQKTEAGRAAHHKATAAHRRTNKAQVAAHNAIAKAIRAGRLQPWPCEVCGAKAHAHHPHYGAPLLVTWLCPPHHKEAHALTTP